MRLEIEQEIKLKYEQFIKYYIVSVECALLFFSVVFYLSGIKELVILDFTSFLVITYLYYILKKFIADYFILIQVGIYVTISFLYIHVLVLSEIFPIMYSLFFLIPLGVYILMSFKEATKWLITVVVLSVCSIWVAPFLADLLNIHIVLDISPQNRLIINYSFIGTSLYFAFLLLYFFNSFNTLKMKKYELGESNNIIDKNINGILEKDNAILEKNNIDITENNTINKEPDRTLAAKEDEQEEKETAPNDDILDLEAYTITAGDKKKFEELFNEILKFFEEKKPYRDPEYTINKLALSLNTNTTYIYRTLRFIKNTHFKSFLNQYRINEIKEQLNNKEHGKYTLKHIYNNAGFSHQATFNRIFKEIEGITPSEYIETL